MTKKTIDIVIHVDSGSRYQQRGQAGFGFHGFTSVNYPLVISYIAIEHGPL